MATKKKSWSTLDFSGGLQASTSIMNHKETELSLAKNVDFTSSLGGIRKRNGYTQYGSTLTNTPEIMGLYDYEQNDGTHIYLAGANVSAVTLDQSQTNTTSSEFTTYGVIYHAQTITSGISSNFIGIKVFMKRLGVPQDLVVELWDTTAGAPKAVGDRTVLSSQRISYTSITSNYDWNTIWMLSYAAYTSGTVYAIVFRQYGDGGDINNRYVFIGTSTASDYSGGQRYYTTDSAATWIDSSAKEQKDMAFKVYYLPDNSDVFRDVAGTWTAQSDLGTKDSNYEFETFLNKCFIVNYNDNTRSYNGTTYIDSGDATAYLGLVLDAPKGRYIKKYGNRLWIANNSTDRFKLYYSSPIMGYEGAAITNINGTHSSATTTTVTVDSTQYLKDGMKFDVYSPDGTLRSTGNSIEVLTIASSTTFTIGSTDLSSTNWADNDEIYLEDNRGTEYVLWDSARAANNKAYGTNWLSVSPDDGEQITWLETAFDRLIIFKSASVWTVDQDINLSKVADRGTPCGRSIVNINENVIFFNPDGFYKLSGEGIKKISYGIEKYTRDISPATYSDICAGGINNKYIAYVGSLPSYGYTNVALEYDTDTEIWTLHTLADEITVFTPIESAGNTELWFGTSDGEIHRWNYGSTDDGTAVSYEAETGWFNLNSPNIVKPLTEVFIYSDNSPGVQVKVSSDEVDWVDLGETSENIVTRFQCNISGRLFKLRFEHANEPTIEICGITFVWEETDAK